SQRSLSFFHQTKHSSSTNCGSNTRPSSGEMVAAFAEENKLATIGGQDTRSIVEGERMQRRAWLHSGCTGCCVFDVARKDAGRRRITPAFPLDVLQTRCEKGGIRN